MLGIKFLSEQGIKQILLKTEGYFMQEQNRNMHLIDDELYFVIEEKQNTVDIMDKGIELISKDAEEAKMFIMPDVGAEIAELEKEDLDQQTSLLSIWLLSSYNSIAATTYGEGGIVPFY